ncbi:MAG: hypothetical protein H6621_05780 [Halobacteriovoraceae bacterium]|nr:hypothetical protein [Halobacteriovoraceae bacterium]
MKRINRVRKKFLKENGISLPEILISMGLVGLITLVISKGLEINKKNVGFSRTDSEVAEIINLVQGKLLDKTICNNNFRGLQAGTVAAPRIFNNLFDGAGAVFLSAGNYGQSGAIRINAFRTSKPNANFLDLVIDIQRDNSRATGPGRVLKTIQLPVAYNAGDPGMVDDCLVGQDSVEETFEEYTCDPDNPNDPGILAGIYNSNCEKVSFVAVQDLTCPAGTYLQGVKYNDSTGMYEKNCIAVGNLEVAELVDCSSNGNILKDPDGGAAASDKCGALEEDELISAFKPTVENCYPSGNASKRLSLVKNAGTDQIDINCVPAPPAATLKFESPMPPSLSGYILYDTVFSLQPKIGVYNGGILDTSSSAPITLELYSGAGCTGAPIASRLAPLANITMNASSGIANYSGLFISSVPVTTTTSTTTTTTTTSTVTTTTSGWGGGGGGGGGSTTTSTVTTTTGGTGTTTCMWSAVLGGGATTGGIPGSNLISAPTAEQYRISFSMPADYTDGGSPPGVNHTFGTTTFTGPKSFTCSYNMSGIYWQYNCPGVTTGQFYTQGTVGGRPFLWKGFVNILLMKQVCK